MMPLKTFHETLQSLVSVNRAAEWLPESWINAIPEKVKVQGHAPNDLVTLWCARAQSVLHSAQI